MAGDLENLKVYRMVPIENLEVVLRKGLLCKTHIEADNNLVSIGNKEIIERRYKAKVKCYPNTVVNDYVAFYFSVRTPMLFNINTGWGNVSYYPQKNIVYLCFKVKDLAKKEFQWCYTDGNASLEVAKFSKDLKDIETHIDWNCIRSTDYRGKDRIRKKHAEFLVKGHVPSKLIYQIVVINNKKKEEVENILKKVPVVLPIKVNLKYYF